MSDCRVPMPTYSKPSGEPIGKDCKGQPVYVGSTMMTRQRRLLKVVRRSGKSVVVIPEDYDIELVVRPRDFTCIDDQLIREVEQ